MQTTFDTACRILPTLTRDELRRLQERIVDILRGDSFEADEAYITEAQLEAELDDAIAAFDRGEGYSADVMSERIRARFGW